MKLLFWGTPAYAVPTLEALVAAGHQVVGVVSQPDRRRGRGGSLLPSAVKQRALDFALPVFTPERIRRQPELQQQLASLGAEASVVVAFGQLLPPAVLAQPPLGCWNGHGSLLPRWRGAAPIQWSLIEGDSETGVGIMAMEEGLDTGPVLLERRIPIALLDNAQRLGEQLSRMTAELMVAALPRIAAAGAGAPAERLARLGVRPQSSTGVTLARLLVKDDYRIDWNQRALTLHRRVMGLYPGAHCLFRGQRIKLLASEPLVARLANELSPEGARLTARWQGNVGASAPGTVLALEEGVGLVVATGGCPLLLRTAQLEGRRVREGQALLQQLQAEVGERFDT
jgi:methionyl-tRNA formyltransferase